jgi:hypothetical protein
VTDRAFVIQQVGANDSPERRRADEIYKYIIVPAVKGAGLEPYRADLDLSPGAVTSKMLSELLVARVVIADLTGRNPNVFYELGITHSFARPLISIADSASSLPFDAKDERVIELGEYPVSGLAYAQGEKAKTALEESLSIVLSDKYSPPSPLRKVATNHSVDELAPEDPIAAELAQMRETLGEIRKAVTASTKTSPAVQTSIDALRAVIKRNMKYLDHEDINMLSGETMSTRQNAWARELEKEWRRIQARGHVEGPEAMDAELFVEDDNAADERS